MISRSSAAERPGLKSTCAPGMRVRIDFDSGESSSLMRMRMGSDLVVEAALRRRQTLAQLDPGAQVVQAALDRPDDHQHVEVVEVAQVRDAEDLALGGVLAADQLDPILLEEVFAQLLGVHELGRDH